MHKKQYCTYTSVIYRQCLALNPFLLDNCWAAAGSQQLLNLQFRTPTSAYRARVTRASELLHTS